MKQIGVGLLQYFDDNKRIMPGWVDVGEPSKAHWNDALYYYMFPKKIGKLEVNCATYEVRPGKWIVRPPIICPADDYKDYGMNLYKSDGACTNGISMDICLDLARVKRPSERLMIADTTATSSASPWSKGLYYVNETFLGFRHLSRNGAVTLFVDGHAAALKKSFYDLHGGSLAWNSYFWGPCFSN